MVRFFSAFNDSGLSSTSHRAAKEPISCSEQNRIIGLGYSISPIIGAIVCKDLHTKFEIPRLVTANSVGKKSGWVRYKVFRDASTPIARQVVSKIISKPEFSVSTQSTI